MNGIYAEKRFLESSPRRKNTAKAKLFFHDVKSGRCISFMHTSLRNTWFCLCWVQGVLCILWNYFCMSGSLLSVFISILWSMRHHQCLWEMAKIEWWITSFTFLLGLAVVISLIVLSTAIKDKYWFSCNLYCSGFKDDPHSHYKFSVITYEMSVRKVNFLSGLYTNDKWITSYWIKYHPGHI